QITTCDQSSGRSGEAVRRGDRRWSEAVEVPLEAVVLEGLRQELETMVPLVKQVTKQTRARIFRGDTRTPGKILSLFEPSTELIRKGKAAKPNEFGKMVKLQEAENQIVVDYVVYAQRPNDADLLIPAIETRRAKLGRTPYLVAADAGFYSAKNEAAAKAKGVKRVCIPNRSTQSKAQREQTRIAKTLVPEYFFLKPPSAIVGPEDNILIPKNADSIFPELELCVVIGKQARHLSKEQAFDSIFGYTIMLDVTARGYGLSKNLSGTRNVRK